MFQGRKNILPLCGLSPWYGSGGRDVPLVLSRGTMVTFLVHKEKNLVRKTKSAASSDGNDQYSGAEYKL